MSYSLCGRRSSETEEKASRAAQWRGYARCCRRCAFAWWFMSSGVQQNVDGSRVWDELNGLLTDRSCLHSAVLYDGDGKSDKAGPEGLFSDVSVNKMEEEGKEHNSVTLKKHSFKIKWHCVAHETELKIVTLLSVCVHIRYCWPSYLIASWIIFLNESSFDEHSSIDLIIRNAHNAERELYCSALRDEKHVRLMAWFKLPAFANFPPPGAAYIRRWRIWDGSNTCSPEPNLSYF